ncbi:hypothetical protein V6R21_28395 [Limibacter armeniacum]|uniref:hypothetical protein n=1 Tax=Limibacter armeniacum TaxID=466084 RepID=UPI002FE60BA2
MKNNVFKTSISVLLLTLLLFGELVFTTTVMGLDKKTAANRKVHNIVAEINSIFASPQNEQYVIAPNGEQVRYVEFVYKPQEKTIFVKYFSDKDLQFKTFPKKVDFANFNFFQAVDDGKTLMVQVMDHEASKVEPNEELCLIRLHKDGYGKRLIKGIVNMMTQAQDIYDGESSY